MPKTFASHLQRGKLLLAQMIARPAQDLSSDIVVFLRLIISTAML
jgi:hypothetical protein